MFFRSSETVRISIAVLRFKETTTYFRPFVVYEAEARPIRKTEWRKLPVFKRKTLKKIFGAVMDTVNNEWKKRDIRITVHEKQNIVEETSSMRLQSIGRVRRNQNALIRTVLENGPSKKKLWEYRE